MGGYHIIILYIVKKESKNSGISKACPKCGKMVLSEGNFFAQGYWKLKCPYCGTRLRAEIIMKIVITVLTILLITVLTIPWIVSHHKEIIQFVTEKE